MVDDKEKTIPLKDKKVTVQDTPVKKAINPIAAEAIAPKPKPMPSKIKEAQDKVAERKEKDLSEKPSFNELMKSMRKQTKRAIDQREKLGISKQKPKPKSFPKPNL